MGKIEEATAILKALGLPKEQHNERSGLTLLALLDLKEDTPWRDSKQRLIRIHDIMEFIKTHYDRHYAENTRETIRRQTLHQFLQAGVAVINPDDPNRPTNSPKNVYAASDEALTVIQKFGSPEWSAGLDHFIQEKGRLIERYQKRKKRHLLSLEMDDTTIELSPGKHNELQIKIINEFRKRFCPQAKVVYVGDTARKLLYQDNALLAQLNIPITKHEKLPDVVLYDPSKDHLILIEAVTAHGPLSPKRQIEIEEMLTHCQAKRIYISAFPDFREFKRHINNVAWETEVWLSDNPDHMIHFNGPKFFTVYE
jgi:hypothetical protein